MRARSLRFVAVALLSLATACGDSAITGSPTAALLPTDPSRSDDPKLLVCPSALPSLSAVGTIGPEGGTLSAGGLRLEVPAGAVLVPTVFELVVPPSRYMEVALHAVGVEHFVFEKAVTVTVDYGRCAASAVPAGASLQAVHIAPLSKRVLEEMGGVVDPAARTVTFTTGHFSSYAVAY